MLIEAVERPITYRWPGGEVQLEPGRAVDLPEDRALKLLAKAQGKVRLVSPTGSAMEPGCLIHWESMDGVVHGPALVLEVADFDGRCWAYVEHEGLERLVSEVIVTKAEAK